jgi:hypothetical protein
MVSTYLGQMSIDWLHTADHEHRDLLRGRAWSRDEAFLKGWAIAMSMLPRMTRSRTKKKRRLSIVGAGWTTDVDGQQRRDAGSDEGQRKKEANRLDEVVQAKDQIGEKPQHKSSH